MTSAPSRSQAWPCPWTCLLVPWCTDGLLYFSAVWLPGYAIDRDGKQHTEAAPEKPPTGCRWVMSSTTSILRVSRVSVRLADQRLWRRASPAFRPVSPVPCSLVSKPVSTTGHDLRVPGPPPSSS
jgi:hypothetical protein